MQLKHPAVDGLYQAILNYDGDEAKKMIEVALKAGINPLACITDVLTPAIQEMGQRFQRGDIFLPQLVMAADAMLSALEIIKPELAARQIERPMLGKVVIGTVQGDIHDIGKNIVAAMLIARGFEVIDLGVDVKNDQFIRKATEENAHIIAMSSLMTVTMPYQRELIRDLKDLNLRDRFKVLVGGGPITHVWADSIGADGFAENAARAPEVALQLAQSLKKSDR